mgnify:CR=1 FL=1
MGAAAAELPAMCSTLRSELGLPQDLKTLPLISAACDLIGCDKTGDKADPCKLGKNPGRDPKAVAAFITSAIAW